MVNTCQKLSILEKKSKVTKKFVKNHNFLEKIWFLWLQLLRIFGGLYMRLPYVLLWLLGEKVQDVWFCGNFSENVNKEGMFFVRRTHDIQNFSMLKKQKFLNCVFWPRKCSKWPNLVPGLIKNMFWAQKEILKIFDFWT